MEWLSTNWDFVLTLIVLIPVLAKLLEWWGNERLRFKSPEDVARFVDLRIKEQKKPND